MRYAIKGDVRVQFLAAVSMERADAENIYKKAILHPLNKYLKLDETAIKNKLIGFWSDGASVMVGATSGVSARLKALQPKMLSVWCMAHRLELVLKDCFKAKKYIWDVKELVHNIYLFYHKSPLNRQNLKQACEATAVKFLVPTKATSSRWVAHLHYALDVIVAMYPALINHFEQVI